MAAPKVGQVEDGYVFVGGEPSDPQSWKPVTKPAAASGFWDLPEKLAADVKAAGLGEDPDVQAALTDLRKGAAATFGTEESGTGNLQKLLRVIEALPGVGQAASSLRQGLTKRYLGREQDYLQSPASEHTGYRMLGNIAPSVGLAAVNPVKLPWQANMAMSPAVGALGAITSQVDPWTEPEVPWGQVIGDVAPRGAAGAILGGTLGIAGAAPQWWKVGRLREMSDTSAYKEMAEKGVGGMAPTRDWANIPGQAEEAVARLKDEHLLPSDFTLTPPQKAQSQAGFQAAAAANASPLYADSMLGVHQEQMSRLHSGWRRLASVMRPAGVAGQKFGKYLSDVWNGAYDAALKVRAGRGLFKDALEEFGDQRVIPLTSYRDRLNTLIDEYAGKATADNEIAKTTYNELLAMRKTLDTTAGVESVSESTKVPVFWVQSQLEGLTTNANFRRPAYGAVTPGQIRASAGDTYADRELRKALLADLKVAPEGSSLSKARDAWEADSAKLDELENSALGRIFRNPDIAPDRAVKQFFKKTPDEIEESIAILNVAAPKLADSVRSEFLNQLTRRAYGASRKATVEDFSTARYFDLRNQGTGFKRDLFEVLFEGSPWKKEADDLLDVTKRVLSTLPPGAKGTSGAMQGARSDLVDISGTRALLNLVTGGTPSSAVMYGGPVAWKLLKAKVYGEAMKDPEYLRRLEEAVRQSGPLGRALVGGTAAGAAVGGQER